MDSRMSFRPLGLLLLLGLVAVAGCKKGGAKAVEKAPESVVFARPVVREEIEYEEFTGRTEAKYTVDLRARVTGYLDQANFTEGSFVKKDDVLFEVDPRPYQAELDRA